MTANDLRARVVAQAQRWLGRREADGGHMEIIKVYNAIRPLPRGYAMQPSDPWCAAFVSAVGAACGLGDIILPECACDPMRALYAARGLWRPGGTYPAQPGDLIFYDWGKDGSSDHVGIVIDAGAGWYTVIEGNYSDAVSKRQVQHGYEHIIGFAAPDYEGAADGSQETATASQSGAELLDRPEGAVDMSDAQEGSETAPVPMQGAPREICTVALPVLRYGESINNPDEAVRAAQLLLIGRGYRCGAAGDDGEFGSKTLVAVKRLQTAEGLTPDGVIGTETWLKLLGI